MLGANELVGPARKDHAHVQFECIANVADESIDFVFFRGKPGFFVTQDDGVGSELADAGYLKKSLDPFPHIDLETREEWSKAMPVKQEKLQM